MANRNRCPHMDPTRSFSVEETERHENMIQSCTRGTNEFDGYLKIESDSLTVAALQVEHLDSFVFILCEYCGFQHNVHSVIPAGEPCKTIALQPKESADNVFVVYDTEDQSIKIAPSSNEMDGHYMRKEGTHNLFQLESNGIHKRFRVVGTHDINTRVYLAANKDKVFLKTLDQSVLRDHLESAINSDEEINFVLKTKKDAMRGMRERRNSSSSESTSSSESD